MNSNKNRWLAVSASMLALTLGGCVVVPARGYYPPAPGPVVVAPAPVVRYDVMVAPPPPQIEVIGVSPGPGFFWIGGYWNWVGGRHVWTHGRWESHRPGYYWAPHQWHQQGNAWRLEHGHWEQRR